MPIYEYQCESCKEVIEAMQGLADKPLTTCPACTGTLKKLISMSSFQLKGGGWYADGYSSGGGAKGCAAAGSDSAPSCGAKDGAACGGCC
ncbi:FmdB family zinc ribbon protein [Thiovibrio sp. JS02]